PASSMLAAIMPVTSFFISILPYGVIKQWPFGRFPPLASGTVHSARTFASISVALDDNLQDIAVAVPVGKRRFSFIERKYFGDQLVGIRSKLFQMGDDSLEIRERRIARSHDVEFLQVEELRLVGHGRLGIADVNHPAREARQIDGLRESDRQADRFNSNVHAVVVCQFLNLRDNVLAARKRMCGAELQRQFALFSTWIDGDDLGATGDCTEQ